MSKEENISWVKNKVLNSENSRQSPNTMSGSSSTSSDSSTRRNATDSSLLSEQGPPPASDRNYIPGYLRRQIGKNVRAEFLLGTAMTIDKTGILREVGVNYFVLEDYISHAMVMCDLYSVRFVTTL